MAALKSDDEYRQLADHMFLPPKLPQHESEPQPSALLDSAIAGLKTLQKLQSALPFNVAIDRAVKLLNHMKRIHGAGSQALNAGSLRDALLQLQDGQSIAFQLIAQNAAMLVTKDNSTLILEQFELSARDEAVMSTQGRLIRQFPGSAIAIESGLLHTTDFLESFVNTVSTLSEQAVPGMQPQSSKTGTKHDENRDTTSPAMVSEFLFGILRGLGQPAEVSGVTKHIRDEVLWKDTELPWRRSPMWLLIRITLHLVTSRALDGSDQLYKQAMTSILSHFLVTGDHSRLPLDLLYAMSAKIERRLQKLLHDDANFLDTPIGTFISDGLRKVALIINQRWVKVQSGDTRLVHSGIRSLSNLNFTADTVMALPALESYIHSTTSRSDSHQGLDFKPTAQLLQFDSGQLPSLPRKYAQNKSYAAANCQACEQWVAVHLADWAANSRSSNPCAELFKLLRDYHDFASDVYRMNPEGLSQMLLTILELWIACDKIAVRFCPMLNEYRPGIDFKVLQNLLLPAVGDMRRLSRVETYTDAREASRLSHTLLYELQNSSSFAVRYFNTSTKHQDLKARIEAQAEKDRAAKEAELFRTQDEYRRLDALYRNAECEYYEHVIDQWTVETRHTRKCKKCAYLSKRNALGIHVHEWPLPRDNNEARAIVFELEVPEMLGAWRDARSYLARSVLKAEIQPAQLRARYFLSSNDPHLTSKYFRRCANDGTTVLSESKPTTNNHYGSKSILGRTSRDVCVQNGLHYRYYDTASQAYHSTYAFGDEMARLCTYSPKASAIREYMFRPAARPDGVAPNNVIANQDSCPDHMTLEEFKDLCTLPLGRHIQWANILLQLAMPTVDFRKPDTTLVFLQCIHQAGPANGHLLRDSHEVLLESALAAQVIRNLQLALARVKENWEPAQALSTFIAIATRVLTLNETTASAALAFLDEARSTSAGWTDLLREKAHRAENDADRTEFIAKAVEVAMICASTFDVDVVYLRSILTSRTNVATIIRMSMIVQEREHTRAANDTQADLHDLRFRRLLHRSYGLLAQHKIALDDAVKRAWSAYNATTGWTTVSSELDHWLETTSAGLQGRSLRVHYNVLTGELLVNGRPLDQPSKEYRRQPLYQTLFDRRVIEVMPSSTPGFDFSAKRAFQDYEVQIGLTGSNASTTRELIVQTRSANDTVFETVNPRVFAGQYPTHFIRDYVHWLNTASEDIEFRPKNDPWNSNNTSKWTLSRRNSTQRWTLTNGDKCLLGLQTSTSKAISSVLNPLADEASIHCVVDAGLQVDVPAIRLGFSLNQGQTMLASREFPSMAVDEDQSIGTLIGLANKLVLKGGGSNRLVLIPESTVKYGRQGDHIQVTVSKDSITRVHALAIDTRLRRLIDNGDRGCKLYLAFLHALTSSCLPDPLLMKTGTEQALTILRSKAVESFDQLEQSDIDRLERISQLSPGRHYYPRHMKLMQTIDWSSALSFLSQHGLFLDVVQSLIQQARRSEIFFPEKALRFPNLDHAENMLHSRDRVRSSVVRVAGFGAAAHNSKFDVKYDSRDKSTSSQRALNAANLSALLSRSSDTLHWEVTPSGTLWTDFSSLGKVYGTNTPIDAHRVQYDEQVLRTGQQYMLERLPAFHRWLTTDSNAQKHRFRILMWLATMAFADRADMRLIQLVAMFTKSPALAQVALPAPASFQPREGYKYKTSVVKQTIRANYHDYSSSPEYRLQRRQYETNRDLNSRRRAAYETACDNASAKLEAAIEEQWPCEAPATPNFVDVEQHVDVSRTMCGVAISFKDWFDNEILVRYSQSLESTIATLSRQYVHLADLIGPSLARKFASDTTPFILESELFSAAAPSLLHGPLPHLPWSHGLGHSNAPATLALDKLISALRESGSESPYELDYAADLKESLRSLTLRAEEQSEDLNLGSPATAQVLLTYLTSCETIASKIHESLVKAATRSPRIKLALDLQHGPRVSPALFLQQLSRTRWSALPATWRTCIVAYGLAMTAVQRAERLLSLSSGSRAEDFSNELRNVGHTNWDPYEYPESLLIEVESGIMIREVQEETAAHMRHPSTASNAVMQLNMGEGKSSVVMPCVATTLADGSQLVRVIVAKPQSKQMAQMLMAKLGGLVDRRVYYMPFSRNLRLDDAAASSIHCMLRHCMENGGVLLVQPEHILSFKLMAPESYIAGRADVGRQLTSTHDFFDQHARDIVDESDENFSVRFELIYTLGIQGPIEHSPDRWGLLQQVLQLTRYIAPSIKQRLPDSIEIVHGPSGSFPRVRLLRLDAETQLVNCIAQEICAGGFEGFPIARQRKEVRESVFTYITKSQLSPKEMRDVEDSDFWTQSTQAPLLLLRGLLACGVLAFTLGGKRWRVDYGLATRSPPTKLAVPYRAKDSPSPRSEFSHPDVVITLTSLSYYYGGLSEEDLFTALAHLMDSDQADIEYQAWVRDAHNLPDGFKQLMGINLKDRPQCIDELFPSLRLGKSVIDYFLSHVVFPKEMKEFPYKLSASGWDIGKQTSRLVTGFSGTNDSRRLLPLDMGHLDLDSQKHTNALVLSHLLKPENGVELMSTADGVITDAEHLLQNVINLDPPVQVILDVGAQILELDNLQMAQAWLKLHDSTKEAVVFVNEDDEICIVDRTGRVDLLRTSSFQSRLDSCLVFLDEAHTRGIDLKLPATYRAAVTVGAHLTKDRLVQACMRMRKLGAGQTVVFCVSEEIQAKILNATKRQVASEISVSDVLIWSITETHGELRRSLPLWAVQGERFIRQEKLWKEIQLDGETRLTKDQATKLQEDETLSIEDRYRPDRAHSQIKQLMANTDPDVVRIIERCRAVDDLQFDSTALQEEQERELSPEIEQERQVQRAPPAEPAKHDLHADVRHFVATGALRAPSRAYSSAFDTLSGTSAAKFLLPSRLRGERKLLATDDFAKTVVSSTTDDRNVSDVFQRPVQWLLASRVSGDDFLDSIMIISPYEANKLYTRMKKTTATSMHIYKPRTYFGYAPLDDLQFYTVIKASIAPPNLKPALKAQLNLFAGQLYLSSHHDYLETCSFLGISPQVLTELMEKEGWKADADGFILSDSEGRVGGSSGLQLSPVNFLKVLLSKIRRNGERIKGSHMGRLLEGGMLKEADFEE